MAKNAPVTLADLKPASYNPRSITDLALKKMRTSYDKFGDLSGIVYNETTGNIIGGHQRVKIFEKRSKIERKAHRDSRGTTAIGYVVVKRDDGTTTRIPFRQVRFSPDQERAANIAANAGGGEFDQVKLGRILRDLENRKFDIEDIPLDGVELKNAIRLFEANQRNGAAVPDAFVVIDEDGVESTLDYCCPKCGYKWSGAAKPSGVLERHRLAVAAQVEKRAKAKTVAAREEKRAARRPVDVPRPRTTRGH